jgi:arabinofuranosyltransferase
MTLTQERHTVRGRVATALGWRPASGRAKGLTFLALCALALASLVVIWQIPYHFTINVGDPSDTRYVRGVYDPEGKGAFTYRWTEDLALIRLPQGVFPGEADVVLSGNRPGAKPPQVTFGFEGDATSLTRAQSTTDFAVYPVRLPATSNPANPALTPELTLAVSDTTTPPKENRALGVAVERVVVYTNPLRFGPVIPPPLVLLLVLGMIALLALLALSVAPSIGPLVLATYGPVLLTIVYLALRRADDPGELAHGAIGFTAAAVVAQIVIWARALRGRPWVRRLTALDGRWLVGGSAIVALGYALYASHLMFNRLYDDTHITLRYAQNLADGFGLRFNPGERPVEGYTNFLLTVVLAGAAKIGLPLMLTDKCLSIAAAVGVVIATYWLSGLVLPDAPGLLRATPSLVMAFCGWFAYYAAIGLETHLFALLVTVAACLVLTRRWPWASAVFALAYLTRPEGAGLWAVTLGWLVWQAYLPPLPPSLTGRGRVRAASGAPLEGDGAQAASPLPVREREQGVRPVLRTLLSFTWPFVLIAGAHETFRLAYYHSPLPNTFYDKVGTAAQQVRRGIDYLLHSIPQLHPVTLIVLLLFLVLLPSAAVRSAAARYIVLLVAAFVGYIVLVGGDFIGPRFFFHVFPLIVVAAVAGVRALLGPLGRGVRRLLRQRGDGGVWQGSGGAVLAAVSVAMIAVWLFAPLLPPDTFMKERVSNTHMRVVTGLTALGEYLRDTAPPGSSLAIDAAGVVPFISRLPTLDMLGLSDYHIAHTVKATGDGLPGHEKTDPAYILAQRPTYIAVGMSKLTSGGRPGRGLDLPNFDALYQRVALVQMTATKVSPSLVLVLTPDTDVQAAIDQGFTYALYKLKQ